MKRRIQIALGGTFLSILAHLDLTRHYYPLKFGYASGQSVCNLNAKFDCDAVSASAYSAFAGIPLSAWGLAFNAVLFMMILLAWLEWSDHPERLRRWTVLLSGLSLGASVVMGSIALTMMNNYCLFCIALYVLSAIVFFALKGISKEPFLANIKRDVSSLFSESRGILLALVAIPGLAFMSDRIFTQSLGGGAQVSRAVNESIHEWSSSPAQEFVAKPSLATGPEKDKAAMTLVEFADFRCGHCKRASFTLHAFVRAHPEVRFEFYSFPLDGACNDKITQSNGISCRMASAVVCAEKESKGWEMHDFLFDKQEAMMSIVAVPELDKELAKAVANFGLNWETMQRCLDQPETLEAVKNQAKQGALVNVMGTPTVFANGKLLSRGQMMPVLQKVLSESKNSTKL